MQVCRGQYSPSPAPRATPYHIVDYVQAYTHSISIMVSLHPVVLVQSIILDELLNAFRHIHVYIYIVFIYLLLNIPHMPHLGRLNPVFIGEIPGFYG